MQTTVEMLDPAMNARYGLRPSLKGTNGLQIHAGGGAESALAQGGEPIRTRYDIRIKR